VADLISSADRNDPSRDDSCEPVELVYLFNVNVAFASYIITRTIVGKIGTKQDGGKIARVKDSLRF